MSCITSNVTAALLVSTWRLLLKHYYSGTSRVATPFGGFGKAPATPFKTIQLEPLPDYPELQAEKAAVNRPSFNRSALGWVSTGDPVPLPSASLEPVLIPESDDLWTSNEVTQRCCLLSCCTRGCGERGNVSVRTESGWEKVSFWDMQVAMYVASLVF